MLSRARYRNTTINAKAILDIPKTLEVLETQGVPVIAYGQDDMPAFWSRNAGIRAPLRMDTPAQIAAAHTMRGALGLPGGGPRRLLGGHRADRDGGARPGLRRLRPGETGRTLVIEP